MSRITGYTNFFLQISQIIAFSFLAFTEYVGHTIGVWPEKINFATKQHQKWPVLAATNLSFLTLGAAAG